MAVDVTDLWMQRVHQVHAGALYRFLLRLTLGDRAVLVERYYRGASAAETAARIGVPEGTVKSRAHYALRVLRSTLGASEV
jgi:RNA polymerase sigma-70 factor (ECF subfamily)